jgi:DNA polymerase-1
MMAHFSQEPTLINAYAEGKDVHQATADLVGCSRNDAKAINF